LLFAVLAGIACSTTAAAAEPWRMAQSAPAILPPHEIVTIVRSAGFTPISPAARRGDWYVLRVSAPDGREMRVIVNGRRGEIISAVPVVPAAAGVPAERLGDYEPMAPGYVPPGPPEVYESDPPVVYESDRAVRVAPGGADHRPSSESAIMREESGLLPPPPERFPSRALPPSAPKSAAPVKRAATAPPSSPPLPKPRPVTDASPPAAAPAPADGKPDPRAVPH
jgi:hypothetical protein